RSGDKIIAKLKIMTVSDTRKLEKTDGQRFFTSDKIYDIAQEKNFEIHHGYLESSNTNAILEMQAMIQLQKDYEASQKMITTLDTTLGQLDDLGKV
ncbi:MAG: flagellar basal body rod C-terminal domain-containing protein, partial [Melioribacteraceae bacterium]|nr:flagellar basal body rod C-terminal domain-containing protein [Melioribacteraceae bacterium]